jgi:hypothetical protein
MSKSKKPAKASAHGKLRDLKAKKDPKGGLSDVVITKPDEIVVTKPG